MKSQISLHIQQSDESLLGALFSIGSECPNDSSIWIA